MARRSIWLAHACWVSVAAGLVGPGQRSALAQEVVGPPSPDTVVGEVPSGPIDPGTIPPRADFVAADLRRIEELIVPDPVIVRIGEALDARDVVVVALLARLDSIDAGEISIRQIEDQRLPWLELLTEVEGWGGLARARLIDLQRERERIAEERALWELTLQGAEDAEIPPELVGRIETTLTRLRDVESRVREARDGMSFLADRLVTTHEQITESLLRLEDAAQAVRARLLDRREAPFTGELTGLDSQQIVGGIGRAAVNWRRSLIAHTTYYRAQLGLLLVVYLLLLAQALRLRRLGRSRPVEGGGARAWRSLAERPFSLALGLTLATCTVVLTPPQGSFRDLMVAASIVPAIRLGAAVLDPATHRAVYPLAALALLSMFAGLEFGMPLERIALLCASGVALGVATWLALYTRRATEGRRGWAQAARALTTAGAGVMGLALLAGLFGWVEFARILTEGTGERFFAAFAWIVVVRTVGSLAPAALGRAIGRFMPRLARSGRDQAPLLEQAAALVAVVVWARATLDRFQVWEPARNLADAVTGSALSIGGLTLSAGGVLGAVVILFVTRLIARAVTLVAREELLPRTTLKSGAVESALTLTTYAIYGVGVLLAASALGLRGTQLTVVIGALGVGIGFGLQNIVNNFVSGLILMFERPISVGDTVQTANQWGRVTRIGIRASTIRSYDGAEIIVPNGDLVAREIINWTRSDELRRVEVHVGVAYGSEPTEVLDLLARVAHDHPRILKDPPPIAHMIRFGESSLDFRLRCWVRLEDWVDVLGDLHVSINEALKVAGIKIPFPQRDIHVIPSVGDGATHAQTTRQTTSGATTLE
jgi:potassium efflux system protein